jgi:Flp pilus assembly protein TadG
MTACPRHRPAAPLRPRRRSAGSTAVEFAIVCSALLALLFGLLDIGLVLWTKAAMQAAATLTARCAALGTTACANAQQYAVNTVATWSMTGMVGTGNVWVQTNATCTSTQGNVTAGKNTVVTITSTYWVNGLVQTGLIPAGLASVTLNASACYPNAV